MISADERREGGKADTNYQGPAFRKGGRGPTMFISIIIIIFFFFFFLHGLGRLTCSGIDELPSFPGASTVSSPSRLVVEGVFRKSGVVHSFKKVDPVLFIFGSHVLYSRADYVTYDFAPLGSIIIGRIHKPFQNEPKSLRN